MADRLARVRQGRVTTCLFDLINAEQESQFVVVTSALAMMEPRNGQVKEIARLRTQNSFE